MPQKSLILYSSITGNTEKVALSFKKAFEKKGWECDMVKVDKKTDIKNPPFDLGKYDFLCVGSLVVRGYPTEEIMDIMFHNPYSVHYSGHSHEEYERIEEARSARSPIIVPGPKKGIVFVTYSGIHFGPPEAEVALSALALEMEHLKFKCIGRFSCPGKTQHKVIDGWHWDLENRPNERDLLKAEIFMEEIIEDLH